jgi:YggT family protein
MIDLLIKFIDIISQVLIFLVIISAVLSFIMPPYHQVRRTIDQIIEPMLSPIRRIVPMVGTFDFSPLVLIILIQIVTFALTRLLSTLR